MFRCNPFEPPRGGLSLYVHVPFCERKCKYCAFESSVPAPGDRELWLLSLEAELLWWKQRIGIPKISTCYVGGGTPTTLDGQQWRRLIEIIDSYFRFDDDCEFTVEANPNSISAEHLAMWRDWRVNRVSLGVQSFDDAELEMMGRLHSGIQAYGAMSAAMASGFSVSVDLMFGLPYQTFEGWYRNLKDAAKSGVHHISLYQLSIEQGTPWENMDRGTLSDGYWPYRWSQWYLPQKGFDQYEISNFAKHGHESKHNLNYWNEGEYLGVGPGASGYLAGWRYKNIGTLSSYSKRLMNGIGAFESGERLSEEVSAREAAVLALRTAAGVNKDSFIKRYGSASLENLTALLSGFPKDLYCSDTHSISLTKKGMRVANLIWSELLL